LLTASILKGNRISLTPLEDHHIEDMHDYSSNPLFFQYIDLLPHHDISDTRAYFHELKKREQERNCIYWAIINNEDRRMIGSFGLVDINELIGQGQIGYGLNPEYWGKGLFKEALILCLDFAFKKLKLIKIIVTTNIANKASIRGLQSCGFEIVTILREFYNIRGVPEDGLQLVLTLQKWKTEALISKH